MKMAVTLFIGLCGIICVIGILRLIKIEKSVSNQELRINGIIELQKTYEFKTQTNNKDSIISRIRELQFQQDYYTKQLDIQSNWFILYVTVLFGAFAVFGFVVSRQTIADASANYKDAIAKQHEIHNNNLNKLKYLTHNEIGHLHFVSMMVFKDNKSALFTQIFTTLSHFKLAMSYRITKSVTKSTIDIIETIQDVIKAAQPETINEIKAILSKPSYISELKSILDFSKINNCPKEILSLSENVSKSIDLLMRQEL